MSKLYFSTKRFGVANQGSGNFTICYRQWRDDGHCNLFHGYSLAFELKFASNKLDARNWVVDFGSLKNLKTDVLEEHFDHTTLMASDDPNKHIFEQLRDADMIKLVEVEKTGAEGVASFIDQYVNDIWLPNNYRDSDRSVQLIETTVWETPANSAGVIREFDWSLVPE